MRTELVFTQMAIQTYLKDMTLSESIEPRDFGARRRR